MVELGIGAALGDELAHTIAVEAAVRIAEVRDLQHDGAGVRAQDQAGAFALGHRQAQGIHLARQQRLVHLLLPGLLQGLLAGLLARAVLAHLLQHLVVGGVEGVVVYAFTGDFAHAGAIALEERAEVVA